MTRTFLAIALLTTLLVSGCGGANAGGSKGGAKAFPVEVEDIMGRSVHYVVHATGSVEAFEEVLVTSRIQGVIEKVLFVDGDEVATDSVLVEIEPARFQYQYDAAKAAHDRATAELKDVQEGLDRRERPRGDNPSIFSKEEVELWRTRVLVAQANEREKAAALALADLDLKHSKPVPPIDGSIEARLVQTGQLVSPGTVIARLLRRDPMLLRFNVLEQEARSMARGSLATFTTGTATVYQAKIIHIAAAADRTTRMVPVTAEVIKGDAKPTPGAYATVTVPIGENPNAATVPETAIRPSEEGFLVFVVEDDNKAHKRVIQLGLRTAEGRIEVTDGLKVGEKVVTRGADALRDGVDVSIASSSSEARQ
jgi:RND family efflux transporter MFP subunit